MIMALVDVFQMKSTQWYGTNDRKFFDVDGIYLFSNLCTKTESQRVQKGRIPDWRLANTNLSVVVIRPYLQFLNREVSFCFIFQ